MRFLFPHSHAFPGGRVALEEDGNTGPECVVEFGDGTAVIAEWHGAGEGGDLFVPTYRTAKGTRVEARAWRIVQREDGVYRSERRS